MRVGGGGHHDAVDPGREHRLGESTAVAPKRSTAASAAAATGSVTTSDSTASSPASVAVWKAPIRPSPKMPIRMRSCS